ncbi:hypothetical protein [Litchfieldia alkalitelluris]|uniref:hypothetical protein n=1 Tax=Litchfieldia alkalitelluris TaxID=304268 RepID=UPI001F17BD2E|nr:hypothetical protein [Litchfieldia alkalitelluris]
MSIIIGQRSIHEVQSEIGSSLAEVAYLTGDNLDQYMWSRYGEVKVLSELKEIRQPGDLDQVENLLNQVKSSFPSFSCLLIKTVMFYLQLIVFYRMLISLKKTGLL